MLRTRASLSAKMLVGFCTDVEGDLAHWSRYLRLSKVLEPGRSPGLPPTLRRGCHFVFGGDAADLGGRDLAVVRDLVHLKESYPDRVHLILGNRDINKARYLFVCRHKAQMNHTAS